MAEQPFSQNPNSQEQSSDDEYVFYNVMPKEKTDGHIVGPTLKITDTSPEGNTSGTKNALGKYKLWIFGVIGILVLLAAGYFVYTKFFSGTSDSDIAALVEQAKKPKKQNATSTPASAFTTPQEWRDKYFKAGCTDDKQCGDNADADNDGLTNLEEYNAKTDPNNVDSDGDGLADGDEVHLFGTNPLDKNTNSDKKYTDADFLKGGYNPLKDNTKYTPNDIADIDAKFNTYGIHPPTNVTLKDVISSIYHFDKPATPPATPATTTPVSASSSISAALQGVDTSPTAQQDRDNKRSNAIRAIGIALVKYQADHQAFPQTTVFSDMVSQVRTYIKVATNTVDPVNKDPFVYTYAVSDDGKDFTLTYYSETLTMLIKKHLQDAIKDQAADEADRLDEIRKNDLDSLRTALLLYSGNNAGPNQDFVFPPQDKYKADLLTNNYIGSIPKDPKTGQDYDYQVSDKFNTFTLKAKLDNPPTGSTGWLCNQDNCDFY